MTETGNRMIFHECKTNQPNSFLSGTFKFLVFYHRNVTEESVTEESFSAFDRILELMFNEA